MKNYLSRLIIHTYLLIVLLAGVSLYSSAQGFSPQTQARLQKVIDSFQNNPANPYIGGISAAIKVDELALWQGATGFAARNIDAQNNLLPGGTPFTTDMLSHIYSVTKTFTAPLVLELAREGAFGLDEPIIKYLPLLNAVNPGLNSSVTIRQLLGHESGFSNYTDELALQIAVAFNPTHIWTPHEMVSFVHQVSAPGAERRYSSTNYILLGAIIEAATGKPVEQHYRERFFAPLQLNSMYLGGRESLGDRGILTSPHDNISAFNPIFQLTGQPTFPNSYTNISRFPLDGVISLAFTGGGIVSNAADLAEWGNALFGGRATSKSTLDQMINSISPTPDEDGDKLGYGIFVTPRISETDYFVGHDGRAPGYRSVMFYQPDRKMTLVVVTNYYGADLYAVAKALYEALPDFLCGNENKKESKIEVCFKDKNSCIARPAAPGFIKKGAYLGACDQPMSKPKPKSSVNNQSKLQGQLTLTAHPNPFTNRVTLSFKITQSGPVTLRVYDLNGKIVADLFNGFAKNGNIHHVNFERGKLPAGIYMGRLQTVTGISLQKLVLK
ncbi:MAG TPA: serine hydrolase [Chitinophagaceae bacterium]|nr:serine hydrolase [Chitinophagaceae bacterium]